MPTNKRTIQYITESFTEHPALDTALSRVLLQEVSDGRIPETLRLYRPSAIVAFGPQDLRATGFAEAVKAARAQGFEAINRLAGGRAAVFHEDTIAFSWTIPDTDPRSGVHQRFQELANIMMKAFQNLGIDARVGEIEGEYCPGAYSVNARGKKKLMGVGQRMISKAAHIGGVVVVDGSERIRNVLIPVYKHLNLAWNPETSGSLSDELPSITYQQTIDAILEVFKYQYILESGSIDRTLVDSALKIADEHIS